MAFEKTYSVIVLHWQQVDPQDDILDILISISFLCPALIPVLDCTSFDVRLVEKLLSSANNFQEG